MQEQKSLFLRTKIYLFFIVFLLSLAGCSSASIWNIPAATFKEKIKNGNIKFLLNLNYHDLKLEDIRRMGPEAPYFFYYIFKELKMNDKALSMLKIAWRKSAGLWNKKAGLLLIDELIRNDNYKEAVNTADEYLKKYNKEEAFAAALRLKLEALYWQKSDKDVLKMLTSEKKYFNPEKDPELKLFRAVVSYRLRIKNWQNLFRDLFLNEKYSYLHSRAYAFLKLKDESLKPFMPWEKLFFHAKDLLARGNTAETLSLYEQAFNKGYRILLSKNISSVSSIDDYAHACMAVGENKRGGDFLFNLSKKLKEPEKLDAEEMAARLYRKAGILNKAKKLLDSVVNLTLSDSQRDRSMWFIIKMDNARSYKNAYRTVIATYSLWNNPDYFSDILDVVVSELVYHREWNKLYTLYRVTEKNGPEDIYTRIFYIIKTASSAGLFTTNAFKEHADRENIDSESIFNYYLLLDYFTEQVNTEKKEKHKLIELMSEPEKKPVKEAEGQESDEFALVDGFNSYGMPGRAYREAIENHKKFKDDELFRIAALFMRRGSFRQSLNLTRLYLKNLSRKPTSTELKLFFPEIFTDSIEKYSKRDNIPDFLLYSLIREESHFDKDIVSRAGAVGLMQLLPVTARDAAKKLKLESIDLKNPDENLNLGAKHFGDLYRRLKNMPKAILAYNAGLKRLRIWEGELEGLPNELFIEAVPYKETHDYFKKVFVSSVFYACLYDKFDVNQVINYFFLTR